MVGGYLPLEIISKEVLPMRDFEIISLVVSIGTLVITAVAVGITIGKNNRH